MLVNFIREEKTVKWEYAGLNLPCRWAHPEGGFMLSDESWDKLNEMGEEGWELVHIVDAKELAYVAGTHVDSPSTLVAFFRGMAGEYVARGQEEIYHLTFIFKRAKP